MSVEKYYMSWDELVVRLEVVDKPGNKCYGIPRGGMIVSAFLKHAEAVYDPNEATHFIDDIVDSGRTKKKWMDKFPNKEFWAVVDKEGGYGKDYGWVVFPFEDDKDTDKEDNAVRLLQHYGKDLDNSNVNAILEYVKQLG